MEEILKSLVATVPGGVAVIVTVALFLKFIREGELQRTADAKERETERRAHELVLSQQNSKNIQLLVKGMEETYKAIADNLKNHEDAEKERYEKLHITQDLIEMAAKKNG